MKKIKKQPVVQPTVTPPEPANESIIQIPIGTDLDDDKVQDDLMKENFIDEVKGELLNNYTDVVRMREAYSLITGGEMANIKVMRRTILNYND